MKAKQTRKKTPQKLHKRITSHAKHVLVPHKDNGYRPHLIRAHGIIAVLVIALVAQLAYGYFTTGRVSVLGQASDINIAELLTDTNAEREKQGLEDLTLNPKLTDAAYLKVKNMFAEQYWAHVSPSGTQPWKWFSDAGYDYSYAGENLAKNYANSQATVDAWMASTTHRENILNSNYVDVGFAVMEGTLDGKDTTIVVAEYGAPTEQVTLDATGAAGTATGANFESSTTGEFNPMSYFASAVNTLSPVTIGILGLLAVVGLVGAAAHHYRDKLPKPWRKNWRVHQGLYTFLGMIILGILVVIATGSGSV